MDNPGSFAGFAPLSANYLHCPNQFFDTCVRFCRRGEIRLIGYLVFQSYRLLDDKGRPSSTTITIKHSELRRAINVSTGALNEIIDGCDRKNFIECTRSRGIGEYLLKYSDNTTSDPNRFGGFYTGRGCWSPIPNQFFTHVIPHCTLAEIRIAGAVLRHTLGYEEKMGLRRKKLRCPIDDGHGATKFMPRGRRIGPRIGWG